MVGHQPQSSHSSSPLMRERIRQTIGKLVRKGNDMFIQTEATPNPATLKFLPGKVVLEEGTMDFRSPKESHVSPLAEKLFSVEGVEGVFFGFDFVSVTKGDADWQHIKPAILGAIMEHFMSGAPTLKQEEKSGGPVGEDFDDADADTVTTIKELLETRVRPAVAQDGGDITPSMAIVMAWSSCRCAAPAPVARPRRRPSSMASKICCVTSCPTYRKSVRSDRRLPGRIEPERKFSDVRSLSGARHNA